MRKHFAKSLAVIFAMLGVYFVAFKVLMKVNKTRSFSISYSLSYSDDSGAKPLRKFLTKSRTFTPNPLPNNYSAVAEHVPRWGSNNEFTKHAIPAFFAPLIWMEREVRGADYWKWDGTGREPDWVKSAVIRP